MSRPPKKRGPYKKQKLDNTQHDETSEFNTPSIRNEPAVLVHNEEPVLVNNEPAVVIPTKTDVTAHALPSHNDHLVQVQTSSKKRCDKDSDIQEEEQTDFQGAFEDDHQPAIIQLNERIVDFEYEPTQLENDQNLNCGTMNNEELDSELDKEYAEEKAYVIQDDIATILETVVPEINKLPETEEENNNIPLYEGCSKKLGLVLLIICSLSIRFKLPDEALNYIITLLHLILPPGNNMIKSVYALKDYLKKFVSFPTIHHLCTNCGTHVNKNSKTCTNVHCLKDLTKPDAIGYFIQHSIIEQIQLMCKREGFLKKVRTHRFDHYRKNSPNKVSDVYDGTNYKNAFNKGFLNNPNSVSFSMNTDGVQIFKSSTVSMWPVYLIINELPPTERKLKENIVYYGLWISSKKPIMWSYLKPMHEEICQLEDGVQMEDKLGEKFRLKGTILNCVCDLPARCMVSNSMQFNGYFGCWFCLQPGETYHLGTGGHVHVYPYEVDNPKGPRRNVENLQEDVNRVIQNVHENKKDFIVHGVKGPFWLMFSKHFNVIHGFVIDYMHGICAGVMKMLLVLWFDKQHKNECFSMFPMKAIVSSKLKSITPNLHITRPPRSLDELSHWKTAEFRNFLFLWSIPVLDGVLPHDYYLHFMLLVRGIYILAREGISIDEMNNAESCLFKFVEHFPHLYSSRYLTMNCHQLLHITDCVRSNGPLFANNCFVFEDLNGYVLKHIHGPTGVEMQIINAITKMQALPALQEIHAEKGSADDILVNNIMRPNYLNEAECLEDGVYLLGSTYPKILQDDEFVAISKEHNALYPEVVEFRKIYLSRSSCSIYATSYTRLMKRNQSTIKYYDHESKTNKFGTVKTFVQLDDASRRTFNIAIVHPLDIADDEFYSDIKPSHKVSKNLTKCVAVQLCNIVKVMNYVSLEGSIYVSEFPNRFEKD